MVFWKGILIVLGSALGGLLLGLLFIFLFQRFKKNREGFIKSDAGTIKTEIQREPVTKKLNGGIIKSNKQVEDTLETLIKNHKNSAITENQKPSPWPDAPRVSEVISQNNAAILEEKRESLKSEFTKRLETLNVKKTILIEEQKQSPGHDVATESEIIQQKNTPVENQKNSSKSIPLEKQRKSVRTGGNGGSEFTKQKDTPVAKQKKSSKSIVLEGPETIKRDNVSSFDNQKQSPVTDVISRLEIPNQKNASVKEEQQKTPRSEFIEELETNLAIATTPWGDKLLPFQTSVWDAKHGEGESLVAIHHQELIQLYVDIGLANNIVWLATEIGHRSKELDESYVKLCDGIAERFKLVMPH